MKTKQVIHEIMTESTSKNICDSGSAYGYSYEFNRKNDPSKQPEAWVESANNNGKGDLWYVSTYHYLEEYLTPHEKLQRDFDAFANKHDGSWMAAMEEFVKLYGAEISVRNTYNDEYCLLDGVIQYVILEYDGEECMLLQYHGGCDVRSGYTAPKAFFVSDAGSFESGMRSMSGFCECGSVQMYCNCIEEKEEGLDGPDGEFPDSWNTENCMTKCAKCSQQVTFSMQRY